MYGAADGVGIISMVMHTVQVHSESTAAMVEVDPEDSMQSSTCGSAAHLHHAILINGPTTPVVTTSISPSLSPA